MAGRSPKNSFNPPPQEEINSFVKAAGSGDNAGVGIFLARYNGAAIDQQDSRGRTALIYAAMQGNRETAELLLTKGAKIDAEGVSRQAALMWAVYYHRVEMAAFLLERGADPNKKNTAGKTALMFTAMNGNQEVAELLLESGADINETDRGGKTAEELARHNSQPEIAAFLGGWVEKKRSEQAERKKQQAQWLKDTDCSRGLKKPLPAPRPLAKSRTGIAP